MYMQKTVHVKVGTKVQSNGARWKLDVNDVFTGKIIAKKKYRTSFKYHVKWDSDGVVESLKHVDILSMIPSAC